MTRLEAEKRLLKMLAEIVAVYHEYNPNGTSLTLSYLKGHISVNNHYFGEDKRKPIDAWLQAEDCRYDPEPLYASDNLKKMSLGDRKFFLEKVLGE